MKTQECPVCGMDFEDKGVKVKVGGKEATVCCEEWATKAKENPAKYVNA